MDQDFPRIDNLRLTRTCTSLSLFRRSAERKIPFPLDVPNDTRRRPPHRRAGLDGTATASADIVPSSPPNIPRGCARPGGMVPYKEGFRRGVLRQPSSFPAQQEAKKLTSQRPSCEGMRAPVGRYSPSLSAIPLIAPSESSTNSCSGMPIFSHSRMFSRLTEAAKAFSLIRFTTDFALTEAIFLSG